MSAPAIARPARPVSARGREYRRAILEARDLGVSDKKIAMVVDAFRGERADPDDFRAALRSYVTPKALERAFAREERAA